MLRQEINQTGVMIRFRAREGQRDALAEHLKETSQLAADEPGTELWIVHISPSDDSVVWLYELYASDAARAAHENGAAYAQAKEKTGSFLAGAPEVFPLLPVGGKGIGK